MLRRIHILFIFLSMGLIPLSSVSQDTIRLADLYNSLVNSNPISRISGSIDSIYSLKKSNALVSYYPKVDLNATATYQSDVTALSISLPIPGFSMPTADKDMYKFTLDISQLIWDGGITKSRIELDERNRILERNKIDIELFNLKDRLAGLYFNLLTLDIAKNQLDLMQTELGRRIVELESGVRLGSVPPSSLDAIKAEQLKLLQSLDAIPSQKKTLLSSINSITGLNLSDSVKFAEPSLIDLDNRSCLRPEYNGMTIQKDALNASADLMSRKRYPTIAAFAQGGYGKPGLNMLNNSWDTFYLFGAKLSWNIWDWNSTRREKQQIKVQQGIVDQRMKSYLDTYNSQLNNISNEIAKLNRQLEKDKQIIELLHNVTERSASMLKNGTTTSANYISDFNAESKAKIDMELRKVSIAMQMVLLYNLVGNEIK